VDVSETIEIELPDRMDIASAAKMHLNFENVLEQGSGIELKGANVSKLDTAGVQLLTCFFAAAKSQHVVVEWSGVSGTILDTFRFLNLQQLVDLEEHAGASE
jgi:ABC-type transporter Mla MlaB component